MKKNALLLILLTLFVSAISCQSNSSQEESEPNNLRNNANKVSLSQNTEIAGSISNKNDKDYFVMEQFPFSDKASINIKVSGVKGIDMRLSIFHNDETEPFKISNDFMIGDGESLTSIGVKKGDKLTLLVDSAPTNLDNIDLGAVEKDNPDYPFIDYKDYKINIRILPVERVETEPNDIFEDADTITIGKPLTGHFTPFLEQNPGNKMITGIGNYNFYEKDIYKIEWDDDKKDGEDIFVTIALSETDNVNSFLVLFNQEKKVLEFTDNQTFGSGEKILNYTLKSDQDYYIAVMGIHTIKVDSTEFYKYNLLVNYLDDNLNIEKEDNDTIEKANILEERSVSGFISPSRDEDWFAIIIPNVISLTPEGNTENENIGENEDVDSTDFTPSYVAEIKVTGVEGINLVLEVSTDGKTINKTYDNNGLSEGETISNVSIDKIKKLYVRVRRSDKDRRKFVNEENKYVMSYRFYSRKKNMEKEPNDRIRQATPVSLGSEIMGYINPKEDVDNFKIRLENSRKYTIQIKTVDNVNLQWEIYEKSGLKAPNESNLKGWDYKVGPDKKQDRYSFKYIGESLIGETELILSVKDYKNSNSSKSKYNGQGFNTSQTYTIKISAKNDD